MLETRQKKSGALINLIKFLDLYRQYLSIQEEIDSAIQQVIRDSAFIGGAGVRAFEENFAIYQHAQFCQGVANGTDAIEIALEALSLPPGSEVIVPANSFIATSEAVSRVGHRVVFADVDSQTYTLDPLDVEKRISSSTAAIIAVHLYGHPCDMESLLFLAEKYDLKIIEDCAQAHGAEYKGQRVGAIGDVGTFSFYPGKNLGAFGDAGAITTNNESVAKRCRMIANHGRIDKYNHEFEGRNSRLDGLQAEILNVKLRHLDLWIEKRNEMARFYLGGLKSTPEICLPRIKEGVRHAFHLFVIRTDHRDELVAHLSRVGIQTGIHYPTALPRLKAYSHMPQSDENMLAVRQCARLLSLPMGEHLCEKDVAHIVTVINDFFLINKGAS